MRTSLLFILTYLFINLSCCKIRKMEYDSDGFFIQVGKVDQSGLNGVRDLYEFEEGDITYDNGDFRNIHGSIVVEKKLTDKIDTNKLYPILDSILVKSISGKYTCERLDSTNTEDGIFIFISYRRFTSLSSSFLILIDNCFYSEEFGLLQNLLNEELLKAGFNSKIQLQENQNNGCGCKKYFWEREFIQE